MTSHVESTISDDGVAVKDLHVVVDDDIMELFLQSCHVSLLFLNCCWCQAKLERGWEEEGEEK